MQIQTLVPLIKKYQCIVINNKTKSPQIQTVVKIAKALDLTNDEFAELCGYRKDD